MENTKPWWQSKTLWFNAAVGALAAAEASAAIIQPYVPGNIYAWGMLALVVGNAVLRVVSKAGITL
jgi:hypothetical protein